MGFLLSQLAFACSGTVAATGAASPPRAHRGANRAGVSLHKKSRAGRFFYWA